MELLTKQLVINVIHRKIKQFMSSKDGARNQT
jgi:hypothetical protein